MQYNDILDRLQKYTNQKISQAEMAEALEISQSAISKRITRDSDFGLRDLFKAMNYFQNKYNLGNYQSEINNKNNNINDEITEETVSADYYPEVFGSCGSGKFVLSEQKELIQVPKKFFSHYSSAKKYSLINAVGESMMPAIHPKDRLIVEHWSGEQIRDNQIYVFCYNNEIFVKRLIKNVDEVVIKSDNPDPAYRTRFIEKSDMNNLLIIGEIVGLMRDLR